METNTTEKMPPTRLVRYCCEVLKETSGKNRAIATGVRWGESTKRQNRGKYESIESRKDKKIILMDDNAEDRRLIERCELKTKITVNPIIDWDEKDVWNYLSDCNCQSNPLYKCGFKRVGCIGCPVASKSRWKEFEMYPKYKDMYISAFDRMLERKESTKYSWQNGHDVFLWWMEENPDQMAFEGFNGR